MTGQDVTGSADFDRLESDETSTGRPGPEQGSGGPAAVVDALAGSPLLGEILGSALPVLERFHDKLQAEGELRGLIGPSELPRLWERHILNSAALAPFVRQLADDLARQQGKKPAASAAAKPAGRPLSLADIGSGAGFPGIVLAALFPQASFVLIEPMERRVEWLNEVVTDLGLTNVRVLRARAEDLAGRRLFDVVTCRAVAPMTKLSHWTLPLLKSGGSLLALKGRTAQAELDKAAKEIRKEGGLRPRVHVAPVGGELESTFVVSLVKR